MKVKLSDIVDAIEMMDQYSEYFLDKETGEIEWVSDMSMTQEEQEEVYDRLDEHGFYRLPTSFDIRDYNIMEDFVDTSCFHGTRDRERRSWAEKRRAEKGRLFAPRGADKTA